MLWLCCQGSKTQKWWPVVAAISIYALVFGCRYGVGSDFFSYLEIYKSANGGYLAYSDIEAGFFYLMKLLSSCDLHYTYFFGIVAFLQLYLVFKSVKPYYFLYPFLAFTFMFGAEWLKYANGLRQVLAFCLFVFSFKFIVERKIVLHYLCILAACLFHRSVLLLIPVYPLLYLRKEWFSNVKIQLLLLAGSLILMNVSIVHGFLDYIEAGIDILQYSDYLQNQYDELIAREVNLGAGFYIILFINIINIYFSRQVKEKYKNTIFPLIYNLYFIGICWNYLFIDSQLLGRINYYFYGFAYIAAAFTMAYLFYERKKSFLVVVGLYILLFAGIMYRMDINTARFVFNWQTDLYYLK